MNEFENSLDVDIKIVGLLGKDDPVILECGAHDGEIANMLFDRFPKLSLYSFEPDPRNILSYKKKVPGDRNYRLFEAAVSNVDGIVLLNQSSGFPPGKSEEEINTMSSTIKGFEQQQKVNTWVKYLTPIEVKSIRLDTWAEEENVDLVDLMWVDVEGATGELIEGAKELLSRTHYFYTECWFPPLGPHYGGEISLDEIIERLLPDWELLDQFAYNALFRNNKWEEKYDN